MYDLADRAVQYRQHAVKEWKQLEIAQLPMVRQRHAASIAQWERLAVGTETGAAYDNKNWHDASSANDLSG